MATSSIKKHSDIVSPKDFMKLRHPEKFSDSVVVFKSKLNRSLLEYQLSSLSSRKQENDFEEFSRKLCQYEICPNLRPQTGPTGGGDSKTDSETLPVVSQTRLTFYQGTDSQNKEKIAFAFSIKKGWVEKVKSDVEEIVKTNRNYNQIIFVTSQAARDKTRAALEDELSIKFKIRVTILDRTWILDKIFTNRREKLAIDELELGDGLEEKLEIGPLDSQREKHLNELNTSIEDDVSNNNITAKTVDSSLDAAIYAAELERPRQEVEGLFDRAIRFAEKYGIFDKQFSAIYQKTWTTFFWFEDVEAFLKLYDQVETLALASNNIFVLERLHNLWSLLLTISKKTKLVSQKLLKDKSTNLRSKLTQFVKNETNLSASVQAEAMLCFMSLTQNIENSIEVNNTFEQLISILDKAGVLIGFPFRSISDLLNESDDIFSGSESYEKLQEHLVGVITKREGDISAGQILLNRGTQHLKANRTYRAIDFFGRALNRFYKKESKDLLVRTLFLLSIAYEDVGLLWAARAALLNAASHATSDLWNYGEINTMQLLCYERLKTIELRLGRIGYALEWHKLHVILASQLIKTEEDRGKLLEKSLHFGSVMGLLLIKTPDEELKVLEKLPDSLMKMDLDFAAIGLIYRLSGKELLPKIFTEKMTDDEIDEFFNSYLTQPAQTSLPDKPEYYITEKIELKSKILGCDFIVECPNSSPGIEIGEYVLGALESFLSTTMNMHAVSKDKQVRITVFQGVTPNIEIAGEARNDNKLGVMIKCSNFNPHSLSRTDQEKIVKSISDIVINLVANSIMFKDPHVDLLKLFKDEEVSYRAFSFSSPMISLGNVLGYHPKRAITDWIDAKEKTYSYSIEKSGKPIKKELLKKEISKTIDFTKTDNDARHDEIENVSIIRAHLWDKAGWKGVLYLTALDRPPVIAFMFENEEMATAIFTDWKDTFGDSDAEDVIRLSVLRGISEKNPAWYRVVVTTSMEKLKHPGALYISVSRVHTLTAESQVNLDRFVESYKRFGLYLLAPALIIDSQTSPRINFDLGIMKKAFFDRNAWEVGENDLDIAGITDDTKPIIPSNATSPPVLKVIEKLERRRDLSTSS